MIYPEELSKLIDYYKKLPGIGEKSAERFALSTIEQSQEEVENFSQALTNAKKNLKSCEICGCLTNKDICDICKDERRQKNLITILEKQKDVYAFEKVGNYQGTYHVLNGLISPLDGITPDELNIHKLLTRIKELENPEIIVALKSSIEGDTTTLYLQKILEKQKIKISRLSHGLPMGAEIDYLDAITLDMALKDRKIIS